MARPMFLPAPLTSATLPSRGLPIPPPIGLSAFARTSYRDLAIFAGWRTCRQPLGPGSDAMKLTDFKVLTFDCYGTLIDWESGIFAALQPLLEKSGLRLDRDAVLARFAHHEVAQETA